MKSFKRSVMASVIGLSVIGLSGCDMTGQQASGSAASQSQEAPAPAVDVITLKPTGVPLSHTLEGFIKASESIGIRPQVGGVLHAIHFKEGDDVEKGDLLFQVEDDLVRAELAAAEASLAQAVANWKSAEREAVRAQNLKRADAISDELYERSITTKYVAEAAIKQAEANVERQKVLLDYTQIRAPFAGNVGRSHADVGSLLTANQAQPLVKLQHTDTLHADIKLDSRRYLDIHSSLAKEGIDPESAPVSLVLEDGSVYPHEASVLFSESDVSRDTGTYLIRLGVENPEGLLMPGMYVRAKLHYGYDDNALLVPERAVQRTPMGDATVLVVNEEGVVESRIIEVAQLIDQQWRVTSGISAGERIVTKGIQKAKPGSQVAPQETSVKGEG